MTLEEQMRLDQEKAYAEGKNEGFVEGKNQGKKEVALKMKAGGIGPSLILKITGLSMEEIEKL